MGIKNAGILILVMVVQILCLGLFTQFVLKDVLVESIKQETTKVVNTTNNDVKTKIDNNFKKINELHSKIDTALPITNEPKNEVQQTQNNNNNNSIPNGYTLIKTEHLTRRQKKRLNL